MVVLKLLELERESLEHLIGVAHLIPLPPEIRHRDVGHKAGRGYLQVFQRELFLERVPSSSPIPRPPEIRSNVYPSSFPVTGSTYTAWNLSSQAKAALSGDKYIVAVVRGYPNENYEPGEEVNLIAEKPP